MILKVETQEKCKKCFHFQVCSSVLKNDLFIREVMLNENEPKCKSFVEVVRCKDCIYYDCGNGHRPWCNHLNGLDEIHDDDFCSYGERKGDGNG